MQDPESSNGSERSALVREAADFWLRLRADPKNKALQDETRRWRSLSAAHERAFLAAEETWALAGEVESLSMPAPAMHPRRRRQWRSGRRRLARALASAAAFAGLVVLAGPLLVLEWQSDYRTGIGEKRSIALADGSRVTLDSGSAIALDDKAGRRGARLLAGRAWFDVAKDPARPFTVIAAEAQVTVTGTAFDVGLDDSAIDVALARGSVRLDWRGAPPVAMVPGDRLHLSRPSLEPQQSKSAVASIGSWRRSRLLLENVPLVDGIAQLRRYYSGAIIVTSTRLDQRRVTGVFDVSRPKDALRLMVRQQGATVNEITPWLMIVSPSE